MSTSPGSRLHSGVSRRSLLRGSFGVAVGVSALGGLSACGGGSGGGGGTGFTFLSYLPMESLSMAPELMADTGGYFAEHGLDVTFQTTNGSPQAIQTLIADQAPLTRVGAIDLMSAAADGQPLVNVATIVRGSSIRIVYHNDRPLEEPEDFIGLKIGVPSEGGTSDQTLSLMLHKAGLDPEEAERQVVGLGPGTFELVKRGDIAGYMVSIDQSLTAIQQYPDEASAFDPGYSVRADSQVYTATRDGLEEHGELIDSYLAAIRDACQSIVDDSSLSDSISTLRDDHSFTSLDDDDIAREALEQGRTLWTADGEAPLLTTDGDDWAEGYDELVDAGMIDDGLDPGEWISNDHLT